MFFTPAIFVHFKIPAMTKRQNETHSKHPYFHWRKANYQLTFADHSWTPFCGSGESPPDGPRSSHPGWRSTGWGCWDEPPGMLFLLSASPCTKTNKMCLQKESLLVNDYYFLPPSHLMDGLLSCLQKLPHLFGSQEENLPVFLWTCAFLPVTHSITQKPSNICDLKLTSNVWHRM